MKISLSPLMIKQLLVHILKRFHIIIFVIFILGGLAIVVFLLNLTIAASTDTSGYTPNSNSATFDTDTIDRIKQLKTRDESGSQLDFSGGRSNPFVE